MYKTFIIFISFSLFASYISFGQTIRSGDPEKEKYVSNEILIKFKGGIAEKAKERIYKALGVTSVRNGYKDRYHVLTIKNGKVEEVIEKCKKFKEIKYAEPNHIYHLNMKPDDEFYPFQWHLPMINIEDAWDISIGEGVKVAVIDSGVNPNGNDGFGTRLIQGRDFVKTGNRSKDDNGHGTHVAGTLAQETNNGNGVSGVAPGATILAIKAFNKFGASPADSVVDSVRWAMERNVQVINMSFGGSPFNETLQTAINEALDQEIVLVAAAGNGGIPEISFPAAYDGVISVGAVQFDKKRASYSNHGPNLDIVAPGGNIEKDQNDDNNSDGVLQETLFTDVLKSPDPIWNYYFLDGTSMATPHVSGIVALLLSQNPDLTPSEVRENSNQYCRRFR